MSLEDDERWIAEALVVAREAADAGEEPVGAPVVRDGVLAVLRLEELLMRGADFDQGDALTGWKCLRFSIASPVYYQYHYNVGGHWIAPANAPGIRHVLFVVDDIEASLAGLRAHGGELVGELVNYGNSYRLCYVRGPQGIIIELAEKLG